MFDRAVWTVIGVLVLAIGVLVWRGAQLGLEVVALTPADAAEDISTQAEIRVQFDDTLAGEPAATGIIVEPPAAGEVRVEGDSLTFVPATGLAADSLYKITVASGLRGVQGRRLVEPVTWTFRTGSLGIVYSTVDDRGREQLMSLPISLPPGGGAPEPGEPKQMTHAEYGIWDFTVDAISGQIVTSVLHEDGTSDLWSVAPGASQAEELLSCPQAACNSAAFAPGSTLLAFSRRSASGFGSPVVSPPRLWLLDLESGATAQVFADDQKLGFEPRWSSDRQWLSYLSPDLGGVSVYQVEEGQAYFYSTSSGEPGIWRPGAPQMVISEMREVDDYFETHLFLVEPDTENKINLSQTGVPVEDNSAAWSRDGEWIAFRRKELDGPNATLGKQLWRMRADGSEAQALTYAPAYDYGPPSWSPDGRYLLYHKFPLKGPDVTISVWLLEVETGQEWEVVRPGQRPLWAP